MDIRHEFPSKYLKASDLGVNQPVVVIDHVEREKVGRGQDTKPVLYFAGKEKGMVLNKTNATKITQLTGSPETDDWGGMRIKLFATETEFGGETVECIRIKAAPPNGRPAAPPPPPPPSDPLTDDDIPF